ncbi:MAG: cytochrome c biogenesis protein ResB [Gemmataceae bacterium]
MLKPLASLQVTCVLFALAVGLVFFGTLAQKTQGIWTVVDRYFWSEVVMVDTQPILEFGKIFFGLPNDLTAANWAKFPWPGGRLLGLLMFINLLSAHLVRFKLSWKRAGVIVLHLGVLLLFVGEAITREFQVEQQMQIMEGSSANFTVDTRHFELAVTDRSDPAADKVTVVPGTLLIEAIQSDQTLSHPDLPFDVQPLVYMKNSALVPPGTPELADRAYPATVGAGERRFAVPRREVTGVDMENKQDFPSAYVRFRKKGSDEVIGTYLVSLRLDEQPVTVGDKTYQTELRFTHYYKPYSLHLIKFRFDRYTGTQTAKNYSSQVRLVDPERGQDQEVTIAMNEPLRHRGETFYQSSFTPDEKGTVLQVVRNPGWLLPYISCAMVSVGMLIHFGFYLARFLSRTFAGGPPQVSAKELRRAPERTWVDLLLPPLIVGVVALYIAGAAMPRPIKVGPLDLTEAARLPVVEGGRVKPLDTVARVDLRVITNREQFYAPDDKDESKPLPAIKWLLDAASGTKDPGVAAKYHLFRIENDQVMNLLQLKRREGLRYSVDEMKERFDEFDQAARKALEKDPKQRDLFEAKLLELRKHIEKYLEVWQGQAPILLPPTGSGLDWRTPAEAKRASVQAAFQAIRSKLEAEGLPADFRSMQPDQQRRFLELFEPALEAEQAKDTAAAAWQDVLAAYRANDPDRFKEAVGKFKGIAEQGVSAADLRRVRFETFLNQSALYYRCVFTYLLAGLLGLLGWLAVLAYPPASDALRRAAFWTLVTTLLVHTVTLLGRMYLMDRPLVFVTNLYSSAVFIGWGAVIACLVLERIYPLGIANVIAASIGCGTSLIAHWLAASGDTLEMMVAVLDTNFWLATHVTTVTLGYSATYLAGFLALVYVALSVFPHADALGRKVTVGTGAGAKPMELGKVIGQMVYGVVCLATLLSFVGTVLGGIWADQSWGRFWGWDPKENGAVLIVLWNALILHARWCGLVKDRGMAVLALVGNMITTWSWFGTNQLGVGLHNYGFSKALADGCFYTWVIHAMLIPVALVPWQRVWGEPAK